MSPKKTYTQTYPNHKRKRCLNNMLVYIHFMAYCLCNDAVIPLQQNSFGSDKSKELVGALDHVGTLLE